MIAFFAALLRLFLRSFRSKGNILSENAVLKKENEILRRKMGKKRAHFNFYDKLFLVVLNRAADIKHRLTLVKPETLLTWQRTLIKRFWTFEHRPAKRGRKPVDADIKNLILSMKNDNLLWGVKRIQGELLKLDISLSTKTIRKILQDFRRRGKIRRSLTWKKFLTAQIQSIYAMDFFTVDTMLGRRFYVFAIISHKTREIIQFSITENPTREFVRQQLILFSETILGKAYLIHDNAVMFNIDFLAYNLVSIRTGVEAPNMNSILERFFRSVRREALDNFLLIGRAQIETILEEYVAFYNSQRPHQGIQQQIPKPGRLERRCGAVCRSAVLGGLHHHYFRQAA
jgi:transposase InsO family protein